jgi:hypothetical protein
MAEFDAIKKTRIAGLMLRRDWGKQDRWPTYPKEGEIDLTHMSRKVKNRYVADPIRMSGGSAARAGGGRPDHLYETIASSPDDETKRLVALAQTAVEEACMWAIRAA